nr:RNA-directed DNA polymerase, eukaryota [Tanacetum cinerariifolium]
MLPDSNMLDIILRLTTGLRDLIFAVNSILSLLRIFGLYEGFVGMANGNRSNEDDTRMISKSIFVTNFPDETTSKDLWKVCQGYGTVVEVYILDRKSKAGKRFAFVRFIRRTSKPPSSIPSRLDRPIRSDIPGAFTFASVLQGNAHIPSSVPPMPAMVLDDSWFNRLCNAQSDFVAKERIVWVDIEGVPLHAWSRATFNKIGTKWGEVMELEECKDALFARKRICIKTKLEDNILEKFKIIVHGKIFVIRAKELFVWSPVFKDVEEFVYCTDDESTKDADENKGENNNNLNLDAESDADGVSETCFGEHEGNLASVHNAEQPLEDKEISNDPFDIYGLLRKQAEGVATSELDKSIPFPPGFTSEKANVDTDMQEMNDQDVAKSHSRSEGLCSRIVKDAKPFDGELNSGGRVSNHVQKKGDSFLKVLDDLIKVGQTMGYSMEGCAKDIVDIIGSQGGGILCAWDPYVFHKEQHTISDNFIALYDRWDGECIVMGDFNEVRFVEERMGSVFNVQGAKAFNDFISSSVLADVQLEGYSFTWSHPHLSDHRPILPRDVITDYGATPFRLYHSWLSWRGFDQMVIDTWTSTILDDRNGGVNDDILLSRMDLMKQFQDQKPSDARESVMIDGELVDDPNRVKDEFRSHFANRFNALGGNRSKISFRFPKRLSSYQATELESPISNDEIRKAVWGCGENKSPGLDGFTFDFFHKLWDTIGPDFCVAVVWFFDHISFTRGYNSSFVSLIPKVQDPKFVNDYRPISLIGIVYKVITKILATRLFVVISELISDVQTAFVPGRQILDGPFIINELLSWCKCYKHQDMVFKVDFAKAYDSVRWDYLDDVLRSFGFGDKWCSWIKGSLSSGMTSILVNGSLTSEFQFHCSLKQGDPLAPYLFILIIESLHLSFSRVVDAGIFKGIKIGNVVTISHLFYADDDVFIGEWSDENLNRIMYVLHCFSLASGLKINVKKSHLLGVGTSHAITTAAAIKLGCSVMKTPFKYLGVMVGGNMSRINAWDEIICKLNSRLSKWKLKTLSIGGRLTLLKSVLGSTPIYSLSLYKAPKAVLNAMESIRTKFFNGIQNEDKNITWVKWSKVLAAKKYGGLGVASYFALNMALIFKWVWRFISQDNSLLFRFITVVHGSRIQIRSHISSSTWHAILREVSGLKSQGIDLVFHCRKRVGNGLLTRFWSDIWLGDTQLRLLFPRIFSLELNKESNVADKLHSSVELSLRRPVRGGIEAYQLNQLLELLGSVVLSNSCDRWYWDLNGNGVFCVKDFRNLLDEFFLPKEDITTRWIKHIPIKINVFAWRVFLDRLPTKVNLMRRGVHVDSVLCPICNSSNEDVSHILFNCPLAVDVSRLVCRWWDVGWTPLGSYSDWLSWLKSIRLGSKIKGLFEGVIYVTWWCLWNFRNQSIFAVQKHRRAVILLRVLFFGVPLDVIVFLVGIAGVSILL